MEKQNEVQEARKSNKAPTEKYMRVVFSAKGSPNDTEDVHLIVNGETLVIQREKEVVVPQRFLDAADHATYPLFKQLPNEPRKIISQIKTYPYSIRGEATEEEYLRSKSSGTKKLRQDIARFGFDLVPDQIEGR